jgi:oligosaccharide repeat unit polymerase
LENLKKISLFHILPYGLILSINPIIDALYRTNRTQFLRWELLLLICVVYFLSVFLQNLFNKIVVWGWILFYFLGVLNINSVLKSTNAWSLNIEGGSYLYFGCLFTFIVGLMLFERFIDPEPPPSQQRIKKPLFTPFNLLLLIFPFVFVFSMYKTLGFLPIFLGESFASEMYEYNYGPLYGFKFICIYGILYALLLSCRKGYRLFTIIYATLLLIILIADGKRFMILLTLISSVPVYYFIREKVNGKPPSFGPVLAVGLLVVLSYTVISYIRTGTSMHGIVGNTIEKIPFGVEFKDYIHSFNSISHYNLRRYDFGLSSFGSFMNGEILKFLGFNKDELTQMGSAYVWKDIYEEGVGIRTGIISELYFAYGYFAMLCMFALAFITNHVSNRLKHPLSYFNLIQYSVLYGLIFLLINGQATVFFGCLTLMLYVLIAYRLFKFFFQKKLA